MAIKRTTDVAVYGYILPAEREMLDALARAERLNRSQLVARILLQAIEKAAPKIEAFRELEAREVE